MPGDSSNNISQSQTNTNDHGTIDNVIKEVFDTPYPARAHAVFNFAIDPFVACKRFVTHSANKIKHLSKGYQAISNSETEQKTDKDDKAQPSYTKFDKVKNAIKTISNFLGQFIPKTIKAYSYDLWSVFYPQHIYPEKFETYRHQAQLPDNTNNLRIRLLVYRRLKLKYEDERPNKEQANQSIRNSLESLLQNTTVNEACDKLDDAIQKLERVNVHTHLTKDPPTLKSKLGIWLKSLLPSLHTLWHVRRMTFIAAKFDRQTLQQLKQLKRFDQIKQHSDNTYDDKHIVADENIVADDKHLTAVIEHHKQQNTFQNRINNDHNNNLSLNGLEGLTAIIKAKTNTVHGELTKYCLPLKYFAARLRNLDEATLNRLERPFFADQDSRFYIGNQPQYIQYPVLLALRLPKLLINLVIQLPLKVISTTLKATGVVTHFTYDVVNAAIKWPAHKLMGLIPYYKRQQTLDGELYQVLDKLHAIQNIQSNSLTNIKANIANFLNQQQDQPNANPGHIKDQANELYNQASHEITYQYVKGEISSTDPLARYIDLNFYHDLLKHPEAKHDITNQAKDKKQAFGDFILNKTYRYYIKQPQAIAKDYARFQYIPDTVADPQIFDLFHTLAILQRSTENEAIQHRIREIGKAAGNSNLESVLDQSYALFGECLKHCDEDFLKQLKTRIHRVAGKYGHEKRIVNIRHKDKTVFKPEDNKLIVKLKELASHNTKYYLKAKGEGNEQDTQGEPTDHSELVSLKQTLHIDNQSLQNAANNTDSSNAANDNTIQIQLDQANSEPQQKTSDRSRYEQAIEGINKQIKSHKSKMLELAGLQEQKIDNNDQSASSQYNTDNSSGNQGNELSDGESSDSRSNELSDGETRENYLQNLIRVKGNAFKQLKAQNRKALAQHQTAIDYLEYEKSKLNDSNQHVNQADHYFQTFDDLANRVNKIKVDGYRHHLVKNRGREQKDKIGRLKKMSSTIVSAGEGGVAAKLGFGVLLGLGHLALAFTVPLGIPFIAIQATAIIFAVTIFIGGTLSNNFLIANGFDKTLSFIAKKGHDYDLETGDKRPRLTSYLARLTISSTIVAAITMGCLSFSSNTALISGSVGAVASALGFSFPPVGAAIAGTIVAGFTSVVIFCIFFEGYVDIINRDRWQAFKNYVRERFSVTDKLQAKTEHLRSCGLTWQIVGIHVTNLAKFMLVDIPITGITYGLAVLGAVVNHYLLRQSGKSTLDGITDKLALAESVKNQIMHVGSQIFNVLGPITGYMGISIFYQNGIGNFLNSVKERPGDFAKDLCITVGLMPFAPLIYAGLMGYGVLRVAADPIVQLYRGSKHTLSKLAPYNADHNNTAENPNKDPAIQFQKANRQYAHQYKKSEPYKFKLLETSTNWNTFGQLGAAQDPKVAANLQNHHVPSPAATIAQATGSHGNNAVSVESNKQNFPKDYQHTNWNTFGQLGAAQDPKVETNIQNHHVPYQTTGSHANNADSVESNKQNFPKDCQQKLSHALSTYNWLQNQPVKIAQDKEIEKLISNAPAY